MTLLACKVANAPVVHFEIEPFSEVAFQELAACPLVKPGICMNPMCSQHFAPARSWQRYCSSACRRMDELDMRRIGHKAAPALLAWRAGKYEKSDPDLQALSRVGRRYVSRLSSEWWSDRLRRARERDAL